MKLNLYPKVIPKDTPPPPLTKGGVVVGMKKEGGKEKIYFVGDDCHLLCVGATRSGKSRCLVLESICLLGLAGESIFCSDPKAELFHYTSEFLKNWDMRCWCWTSRTRPRVCVTICFSRLSTPSTRATQTGRKCWPGI